MVIPNKISLTEWMRINVQVFFSLRNAINHCFQFFQIKVSNETFCFIRMKSDTLEGIHMVTLFLSILL